MGHNYSDIDNETILKVAERLLSGSCLSCGNVDGYTYMWGEDLICRRCGSDKEEGRAMVQGTIDG